MNVKEKFDALKEKEWCSCCYQTEEDAKFLIKLVEAAVAIGEGNYDPNHQICADADECRCAGLAGTAIWQEISERMVEGKTK